MIKISKNQYILLVTIFLFVSNANSQEINYSQLKLSAENLKSSLYNDDDYFSGGNSDLPYFQGKKDSKYIKFYKTTGVIVTFDFKTKSEYLILIKEIQNNANFRFKFCTDYDENIIYNYETYSGNKIRFNFNEMRISLEFPSKLNDFLESNSEFTPVFVCVSDNAYAYHTNLKCSGLANCDAKISKTNIKEAKKYNYKICEICTDDSYSKELLTETLEQTSITTSQVNYPKTIDLSFAKKYEGEYMFREICKTEPLKSQLKKILGSELFEKYINYIAVQGPMEIKSNRTLLTSCMAHACTLYESSLLIDFDKNHFYAGILDDEDVYVFSNNSGFDSKNINSYPSEFLEWTKNALEEASGNK